MKIAVVNNFFPPRPGGSSHLADHLAREYVAAGHEVLVITAGYRHAPAEESRDGFRIVRIPAWVMPRTRFAANFDIAFTISPTSYQRVCALLDEFGPDVVHQHGQFFDLTWQSGLWARRTTTPTLLSIHTRLYSPNAINNAIYRLGDALLVKPVMRTYKPRLVVMDELMDRYVASRYRGAFSGTVDIPVGIDPDKVRLGDGDIVRRRHGLEGEHLILSVGHVIPQRNRVPLVEALPEILEEFPNTRVLVVGTVYHDEFLRRAQELGVDGAILTPGAVPQAEMPDYYAAADLETHELDGQGFGTASLEALAVGVPVVAAVSEGNFPGVPLLDGVHLFRAPFATEHDHRADPYGLAQVIRRVLRDPSSAKALVAENSHRLIMEHFTIAEVAAAHLREFERLTAV